MTLLAHLSSYKLALHFAKSRDYPYFMNGLEFWIDVSMTDSYNAKRTSGKSDLSFFILKPFFK
jgi:hypothetical protein